MSRSGRALLAGVAVLLLGLTGPALAAGAPGQAPSPAYEVSSPHASFFDVKKRQAELTTARPASLLASVKKRGDCSAGARPAPPRGRMIMPPYYLGGHGAVNPEHAAAERPYAAFEQRLADTTSRYVASGDVVDAACILDMLNDWAEAGALLEYSAAESQQAWFQAEWTLGAAALALSAVAGEGELDAAKLERARAWLVRAAKKLIAEPTGPTSCCNNHSYWRGLAATAVGVVARENTLYAYGLARFRRALDDIAPDGSFPLEMSRNERALHYQNFAILPLVGIAELASGQGHDLYAWRGKTGRSIHDAVRFLLGALDDPSVLARYSKEPQYRRSLQPGSGEFAWMEAYRRRQNDARMDKHVVGILQNRRLGGNASLFWRPI